MSDIDWPYAYTINIDDGIEKNSQFTPILPYRKLRRPRTSKKLLYKLHGDASHECNYREDGENIVFSQSQYLQAITSEDNTDIYQQLLADYGQRHLLFIGCSLQSEQDLVYVYQKSSLHSAIFAFVSVSVDLQRVQGFLLFALFPFIPLLFKSTCAKRAPKKGQGNTPPALCPPSMPLLPDVHQ